MVEAKKYKNKVEVIADFKRAFDLKRKWQENAERILRDNQLLNGEEKTE